MWLGCNLQSPFVRLPRRGQTVSSEVTPGRRGTRRRQDFPKPSPLHRLPSGHRACSLGHVTMPPSALQSLALSGGSGPRQQPQASGAQATTSQTLLGTHVHVTSCGDTSPLAEAKAGGSQRLGVLSCLRSTSRDRRAKSVRQGRGHPPGMSAQCRAVSPHGPLSPQRPVSCSPDEEAEAERAAAVATQPAPPMWPRARATSPATCSLTLPTKPGSQGHEEEPQGLLSGRMPAPTRQRTQQPRGGLQAPARRLEHTGLGMRHMPACPREFRVCFCFTRISGAQGELVRRPSRPQAPTLSPVHRCPRYWDRGRPSGHRHLSANAAPFTPGSKLGSRSAGEAATSDSRPCDNASTQMG